MTTTAEVRRKCCSPTLSPPVDRFSGTSRRECRSSSAGSATGQSLDVPVYAYVCMYMPNKTISVPDDVVSIIESLDMPFSRWVTEQLRRHAARSTMSFADQVLADGALAAGEGLSDRGAVVIGERMEKSASW